MEEAPANKKQKNEIKFKYIFPIEYNAKYINGVFGGVTSSGEIVANFFFERHAIPISQTYLVEKSGQLGKVIKNDPPDLQKMMVRVVENGVTLNINFAKTLRKWLDDQIEQAEKAFKIEEPIEK